MIDVAENAESWLIADVGATTSRCALLDSRTGGPRDIRISRNDDFQSPFDLFRHYLGSCAAKPQAMALAVAAPVYGDDITMVNRAWSFNAKSLAADLGIEQATVVNDFHAIAFALPTFNEDSRAEIGSASEYRGGNRAVLGPGSGLGMAAWIGGDTGGAAMTGEGGHITVSGRDNAEDEIISWFREKYGHCSAERVLSGPGLLDLHEAMHGIRLQQPEQVSGNPNDESCSKTMNQFFSFLGSAAADLALITGSFGGLYIAGGIAPAHIEELRNSPFRERFDDKNRYRNYMRRIPTYVITDPVPGLTGLAAMIDRG